MVARSCLVAFLIVGWSTYGHRSRRAGRRGCRRHRRRRRPVGTLRRDRDGTRRRQGPGGRHELRGRRPRGAGRRRRPGRHARAGEGRRQGLARPRLQGLDGVDRRWGSGVDAVLRRALAVDDLRLGHRHGRRVRARGRRQRQQRAAVSLHQGARAAPRDADVQDRARAAERLVPLERAGGAARGGAGGRSRAS